MIDVKTATLRVLEKMAKEGEVNLTEMNELERAIENLEDNTDDCYKNCRQLGF